MSNERNYNFGAMQKNKDGKVVAYIEGWTFQPKNNGEMLSSRKVNVNGEEKLVANITLATHLSSSMMKYNFGENFATEDHFIECTLWEDVANRMQKYGPTPKQILGVFGELKVQEYQKKDGTNGQKLVMTVNNFKAVTKKQGANTSTSNQGSSNQATSNQTSSSDNFVPIPEDLKDEVPF